MIIRNRDGWANEDDFGEHQLTAFPPNKHFVKEVPCFYVGLINVLTNIIRTK
jgi:hypothetical protein